MTRRGQLATAVLLIGLLAGCSRPPDPDLQRQRAEQAQRRAAQQRCESQRRRLQALLEVEQLRKREWQALAAATYQPSPAPPALDPEEQRRLAVYDQEIEQEQYEQALALWREREQQRRADWQREHAAQLGSAHAAFTAATAAATEQRKLTCQVEAR